MTIHWKAVKQYNFTQFVMLEHLSILDLTLSGVKKLKCCCLSNGVYGGTATYTDLVFPFSNAPVPFHCCS